MIELVIRDFSTAYAGTVEESSVNHLKTANWILNNFLCSIHSSYSMGSPRREEANKTYTDLF